MANIFQVQEPEVRKEKGRNIVHITRVTGYFAYTEHFNPGKVQELKDRHRETDTQNKPMFSWYEG